MRNRFCIIIFILLSACALFGQKPPINRMKGPVKQQFSDKKPESSMISLYQKYISPIDGDRCPMHPGCSSYMSEAIAKKGLILGVIMGSDRLQRCGRKLRSYPWIIKGNSFYAYDPVEDK